MDTVSKKSYNTLLDSFMAVVDNYVNASLKVRDGEITAENMIHNFDAYMAEVVTILIIIDAARGDKGFFVRGGAAGLRQERENALVEEFRKELGILPDTNE